MDKKLDRVLEMKNAGKTVGEIGIALQMPGRVVERRITELYRSGRLQKKTGSSMPITKLELLKLLNLYKSRAEVARRLQTSPSYIGNLCILHNIMDSTRIAEMINATLKTELSGYRPVTEQKVTKKSGASMVMAIGDWHVDKKIKNETGEIYNLDVFKQRNKKFTAESLKILDKHLKSHLKIEEVILLGLGDFADGSGVYPGQSFQQVKSSPPMQVIIAVKAMIAIINSLLARKLTVSFYGVPGNHGNIDKFSSPANNWDIMIYWCLRWWAENNKVKNLNIQFTETDYLKVPVRKWKYVIRHKAYVQDETAAGNAKYLGWQAIHDADFVVSAHFHHFNATSKMLINGSLCGGDELSERMAKVESFPGQTIWIATDKFKCTEIYPLILE